MMNILGLRRIKIFKYSEVLELCKWLSQVMKHVKYHIIYINQSPVIKSLSTELEVLTVCLLKM